jgi:hypothetical protein
VNAENALTTLAGLASFSKVIAIASIVSVIGFAVTVTLSRLRPGRRAHLSAVHSEESLWAGRRPNKATLRVQSNSNLPALRPKYGRISSFGDDYVSAPAYERLSLADDSDEFRRRKVRAGDTPLSAHQANQDTGAFVKQSARGERSAQSFDALENAGNVYMLEEAYRRRSAPDTGPRSLVTNLDVPDYAEFSQETFTPGHRQLEYAGHRARRSHGAHRRSKQ